MLLCDALLAVTPEPPPILTSEPEYTRALLFHARDDPLEVVEDSPEARRKGWRRIVLLFNFFWCRLACSDSLAHATPVVRCRLRGAPE